MFHASRFLVLRYAWFVCCQCKCRRTTESGGLTSDDSTQPSMELFVHLVRIAIGGTEWKGLSISCSYGICAKVDIHHHELSPSGTPLPEPHKPLRETTTRSEHLSDQAVSVGPLLAVRSSTSLQPCVRLPFRGGSLTGNHVQVYIMPGYPCEPWHGTRDGGMTSTTGPEIQVRVSMTYNCYSSDQHRSLVAAICQWLHAPAAQGRYDL